MSNMFQKAEDKATNNMDQNLALQILKTEIVSATTSERQSLEAALKNVEARSPEFTAPTAVLAKRLSPNVIVLKEQTKKVEDICGVNTTIDTETFFKDAPEKASSKRVSEKKTSSGKRQAKQKEKENAPMRTSRRISQVKTVM